MAEGEIRDQTRRARKPLIPHSARHACGKPAFEQGIDNRDAL
jgi:hypothetical protein